MRGFNHRSVARRLNGRNREGLFNVPAKRCSQIDVLHAGVAHRDAETREAQRGERFFHTLRSCLFRREHIDAVVGRTDIKKRGARSFFRRHFVNECMNE